MFLTISNPVTENIKIHNNTIQTTKQDKSALSIKVCKFFKKLDN